MGALIWLASYPKSGNTWTRAYLNNLLRNPDQPAGINELDWFTLGESSSRWFQDLIDKPITEYSKAEIAELRPKAQEELTKASQDSVFVKTHNILGLWYDHPLHNMDITVAAIYIVRNPLDVCISMTSHYGMTLDQALFRLAQGAAVTGLSDANVPEVHGDWSSHVKSWTQPHPQMLVLRYEDMKHKPFPTFNTMARFLGLKPPKERVRKAIKFSSFKELKKQEQKEEFKERSEHAEVFFREGKSGQWKDTLSEDQIARLLEDHHEQMARFNYLPTDWEERIAAWHKRIATGEAESRE
ncbi:MAG: sulfotransferase domain-containing protein, partial [Alphaproteobacteria bacterium]